MDYFVQTMNSPRGRIVRIALGGIMVAIGLYFHGVLGWGIALAGLGAMVPAFFGHCA